MGDMIEKVMKYFQDQSQQNLAEETNGSISSPSSNSSEFGERCKHKKFLCWCYANFMLMSCQFYVNVMQANFVESTICSFGIEHSSNQPLHIFSSICPKSLPSSLNIKQFITSAHDIVFNNLKRNNLVIQVFKMLIFFDWFQFSVLHCMQVSCLNSNGFTMFLKCRDSVELFSIMHDASRGLQKSKIWLKTGNTYI